MPADRAEGAHATASATPLAPLSAIPGPRGLEPWRLLSGLSTRPPQVLLDLRVRYGDLVLLPFPLEKVLLVSDPEHIEHVLHHQHRIYQKRTPRWKTLRQIWGESVITADGEVWRRQRQRIQPAFHQRYLDVFAATAATEAQRIAASWAEPARLGVPHDVYTDMNRCLLRTLLKAMFGSDIEGRIDLLIRAVSDVNGYINPTAPSNLLNLPIPVRRWVSRGFRPFDRAMREIRRAFGEIIEQRLRSEERGTDLLGLIMAGRDEELAQTMTEGQLHDEMMALFMAGHETTAIAATWCLYWVSQHPEVERTIHEELDAVLAGSPPTPADLPRLDYTRMVFQEVLRLAPPVYAFDRLAVEDDVIGGYHVRKGTSVLISPYVMHRHPAFWTSPSTFDPTRFAAGESEKRPLYAYLPFGGGARRCVGFRFASMAVPLVLATLWQSYRLRLKPGHPVEELARLNLAPRFGMQMVVASRRPGEIAPDAGASARQPVQP